MCPSISTSSRLAATGSRIEAIQASRTVCSFHLFGACILQNTGCKNLLAEIAFVQASMEDNLVDALQFSPRELFRQVANGDSGIIMLPAQTVLGVLDDLDVIETQSGQVIDRKPADVGSIGSRPDLQARGVQQRKVHNGNYTSTRVAPGVAKGI